MYKNQYIVVPNKIKPKFTLDEIDSIDFDELTIYRHSSLNVSISKYKTTQIALLGYIIDPLNPYESNDDIVKKLAENCLTIEEFFKKIQHFTGRYVLLYKTDSSFIITGDACHLRQIYFSVIDSDIVMTSSPKLFLDFFNYELQSSNEKQEFLKLPIYKKQEQSWFGNGSIDDRLNKLLPNHYWDIQERKTKRTPIFPIDGISNEEEVLRYTSSLLKGTFSTLAHRYQLIQPLTAGWDSRILLAANKEIKDKIQYYIFDQSSGKDDDVRIPKKLSKKLGLNFKVIEPNGVQEEFLSKFKKEHVIPRVLPKTANIEYHYNCKYNQNIINVNGNGAEVARCFYGHSNQKVSLDMLLVFSGYHNKIPYFSKQIEKWYPNASKYSEKYGISLLDLFYWEQRMGNWGALFPFEQDIAVEEISPFNNRSLLISLLSIEPEKRKSPNFLFFQKLIQNLWEDVLSEPINPSEKYFKKIIKGSSTMRYFASKIKHIIFP